MNKIAYLIGSKALEAQGVGTYPTSDYDIVCEPKDADFWKGLLPKVEIHDINDLNNREICEKFADTKNIIEEAELYPVSLPGLAIIYRSHLYRDHKWDKNIALYHKFLKNHMTHENYKIAMERKRLTIAKIRDRTPNLNQSNKDFFDDAVVKVYDHDTLHEIVAYYDQPLYTRLKHDEKVDLAWCEKDLWLQLEHEDKLKCVAEETFVIAAERFLIPKNWKFSYKFAYYGALRKVCTTLTSGWFRDFAIDHFEEIFNLFDENRLNKLKETLRR